MYCSDSTLSLSDQLNFFNQTGTATEAGVMAAGTPSDGNVRSWGLDRIDQVNLPLVDAYNPGADGSNVHGEPSGVIRSA